MSEDAVKVVGGVLVDGVLSKLLVEQEDHDLEEVALQPISEELLALSEISSTEFGRGLLELSDGADLVASIPNGTYVPSAGAATVDGVKTFSSAPVVPDAAFSQAKVASLVSDLAARSKKPATTDGTLYVSKSGNDSNDGLSWGTAKLTIGAAVSALPADGGSIRAGDGVYTGTIGVPSMKMVRITGNGRLTSQLTVTAGGTLFTFTGPYNNSATFIVEGFTINGANGAGSKIANLPSTTFIEGEFVLRDCNVLNWLPGAGIVALTFGQSNYFTTFERVYFQNNAGSLSFGLYSDYSITNCIFSNPKSAPHVTTYGGSSGTISNNVFTPGSITGTSPDILIRSNGTNPGGHGVITLNKFGPENEVAGRVKILVQTPTADIPGASRLECPRSEAMTIEQNHFFGATGGGQTAIQIDDPILGYSVRGNHFDSFATLINDNQSNNSSESGDSIFEGNTVRSPDSGAIPWTTFTNGGRGFASIEEPLGLGAARPSITAVSLPLELRNRIPYSEDLSNAAWLKVGVSVTTGQTDPFGTTRAVLLTRAGSSGSESIRADISSATTFKDSFGGTTGGVRLVTSWWAKAGTLTNVLVSLQDVTDGVLVGRSVFQLGAGWRNYKRVFSGLPRGHVYRLAIYPGGLRQVAGTILGFGFQVSDEDSDYLPTTGVVASSTVLATRYEKGVQFASTVIATLPTHADEAAAVTASLATGTIYKTATGEVRVKL